jgi:F-type H+-transporting ATPase subunit b
MGHLLNTAEFWVAVSFFGFIALLLWYRVPGMIGRALDARADAIRKELDEARNLRKEAAAILEDYKRKHGEAQKEAEEILAAARREAEQITGEARRGLKETLERRTRIAEDKIARAEAQALGEVKAAAVDAAVSAAERLIAGRVSGQAANGLIEQSIADLKRKLN